MTHISVNILSIMIQQFSARLDDKIISLPLQFQYLPVQILSKQFTKLNSSHPYRIHYLGPRFTSTLVLHKKHSLQYNHKKTYFQQLHGYDKYQVQFRKIVQSNYLNQKLQDNHYYKSAIFYRAFEGMNPTLNLNDQLRFNSCFQAGNLDCVIKVQNSQFDLFLRIDSNTRGHTQWFYFSIQNGKKLGKNTFNICNLTKPHTLYQPQQQAVGQATIQNMRPYIFSKKLHQKYKRQWEQDGSNISLTQRMLRYNLVYEMIDAPTVYRLSFEYQFLEEDDQVYFAYSIPYTYSQMLGDIKKMQTMHQNYVKKHILAKSLAGVQIPILHIANHSHDISKKKNILITGRVHPGQSNGSHVLKGFMQFLCGKTQQAQELRNRINFFIIPMLNPDGVIMGNSRSSASGKDLNRQYLTFKRQLYPEVVSVKSLVFKLQKSSGIFMFFDFHGHSRKKNTFLYGPGYSLSQIQYYKSRGFAKIIQKINPNFRYYSCSFYISQQKKRTARAVLFQQYKIPYVFTIQSSIGLYHDHKQLKTIEFTKQQWMNIGACICGGLSDFMVAHEDYEDMIRQRRIQRNRRKQKFRKNNALNTSPNKKFIQDQIQPQQQILSNNKKSMLMFDLMQQIKNAPQKNNNNNNNQELSSDDHDQAQDLQSSKLAQFNNLIIQTKQKDHARQKQLNKIPQQQQFMSNKPISISSNNNNNRRQQSETDQFQLFKQMQQQNQNKKNRKIHITKPINKQTTTNQKQKLTNRPPFIHSNFKNKSQTNNPTNNNNNNQKKTQQQITKNRNNKNNKNNNNKYLQTHRHIVSKQFFPVDKCQIVDLPSYNNNNNINNNNNHGSFSHRKDIKKGRVIIQDYVYDKKKDNNNNNKQLMVINANKNHKNNTSHSKYRSASISGNINNQIQSTAVVVSKNRSSTPSQHNKNSNNNNVGFKSMNFDIINSRNKLLKRSNTVQTRKNGRNVQIQPMMVQSSIGSSTNMRIFDSTLFSGFQGLQLDNLAMMIRTFNR